MITLGLSNTGRDIHAFRERMQTAANERVDRLFSEHPASLNKTKTALDLLCLRFAIRKIDPKKLLEEEAQLLEEATGLLQTHHDHLINPITGSLPTPPQVSKNRETSKSECLAKIDRRLVGDKEMHQKMRTICNDIFTAPVKAEKPVVSPSRAQEFPVPLEMTTAQLEILCLKLAVGDLTKHACLVQAVGLFTKHREGSKNLEQSKKTCLATIDLYLTGEGNAEVRDKMRAMCNHIFSAPAVKK